MSDTLTLTVDVADGKLKLAPNQSMAVDTFLTGRRKPIRFVLSKKTDVRNNEQNKFYWSAYVTPIARHTGHEPEAIHEFLKEMFLPRLFVSIGGKELERRKTTRELSPREFSEYLARIEAWSSTDLGFPVPEGVMR